jgi:rubrerythrin
MPSEKPTREWLLAQIEDEQKAHDDYSKHGFYNIAKDEARHKKLLERVMEQEFKGRR